MSPSLPLLPEPMVYIWPSNSLQAPTSDAFLGMVALTPLPRPPWPRPALLLFPPCPRSQRLKYELFSIVLKAPQMVGQWLLGKNPWIMYPGFCRTVSSVEFCKSKFFYALQNPHKPFVIACLLGKIARLPRRTCTLVFFCPSFPTSLYVL